MSDDNQNKDQTPAENTETANVAHTGDTKKDAPAKSAKPPTSAPVEEKAVQKPAPKQADEAQKSRAAPADEQKEKSGPAVWPLWIVLLILVITMGGGGFFVWKQFQGLTTFKQEVRQMQSQGNQSSDAELSAVKKEVESLNSKLSSTSHNLSMKQHELQTRLTNTANQVLQIGGTSRTEWLLAESEYLLRLANQRLNFEKDVPGALAILQSADVVLNESGDAGIYGVREQLKKEMLSLESQALVDQDGIYLEIEAIIALVEKLDQKVFASEPDAQTASLTQFAGAVAESSEAAPEGENKWSQWWSKLKKDLAPLVVFRKLDKPVEPLLSPEQSYYLKQNLRLMLEQAQLALMKKNQSLYEKSLEKAGEWVGTYFLRSNKTTDVLLSKLSALKNNEVNPVVPDISQSLLLLKERIAVLYRRGGANGSSTSEG